MLTAKKCQRCNLMARETTVAFSKRTRHDFNAPFFCKECQRVMKAFLPMQEKKEKKEKNLLDKARDYLKNHGKVSIIFLMVKLKISATEACEILRQLSKEGLFKTPADKEATTKMQV